MSLSPSAVDFEIRTLPENDIDVMDGVLRMFIAQLESRRNFEVVQAYLRLFLNIHSDSLIRNGAEMADALEKLIAVQKETWTGLEGLIHTNLCMINYTTGIHI